MLFSVNCHHRDRDNYQDHNMQIDICHTMCDLLEMTVFKLAKPTHSMSLVSQETWQAVKTPVTLKRNT